jgi:hypothetical protein
VPLLLFWALALVWILPWTAFLLPALRRVPLWSGLKRADISRAQQPWLFCGLWLLVILLFFSFSTRQEYYVLPAIPALALLMGAWRAAEHHASYSPEDGELTEFARAPLQMAVQSTPAAMLRTGRRIAVGLLMGGVPLALAALYLALRWPPPAPDADIATLFRQNPRDYALGFGALSFGHFLDLRLRAMALFRWPLIATAMALLAGTAGNYFFRKARRPGTANMFLTGMACTFLMASWAALVAFSPLLSSYTLAKSIQPELDSTTLLVVNGEYRDASTLNFYLKQPLHILHEPGSDLWYGSFWPGAPAIWETDATLAAQWEGPRRIFVWTAPDKLAPMPGPVYVIAQSGGKQIVSNQANHGGASF